MIPAHRKGDKIICGRPDGGSLGEVGWRLGADGMQEVLKPLPGSRKGKDGVWDLSPAALKRYQRGRYERAKGLRQPKQPFTPGVFTPDPHSLMTPAPYQAKKLNRGRDVRYFVIATPAVVRCPSCHWPNTVDSPLSAVRQSGEQNII